LFGRIGASVFLVHLVMHKGVRRIIRRQIIRKNELSPFVCLNDVLLKTNFAETDQ